MDDAKLAELAANQKAMASDIADIRGAMSKMSDAMVSLARVEERQAQDRGDIARLYRLSDDHERRIGEIEKAQPLHQQTNKWVHTAVTAIVTTVLTAFVSTVVVRTNTPARADVPPLTAPAK
jgi:hypothetical protein